MLKKELKGPTPSGAALVYECIWAKLSENPDYSFFDDLAKGVYLETYQCKGIPAVIKFKRKHHNILSEEKKCKSSNDAEALLKSDVNIGALINEKDILTYLHLNIGVPENVKLSAIEIPELYGFATDASAFSLSFIKDTFSRYSSTANPIQQLRDFVIPDTVYVAMKLIRGYNLTQLMMRKGKFPEKYARHIFIKICEAFNKIHCHQVFHSDAKAENILAANVRYGVDVIPIDFGLSKDVKAQREGKSYGGTPSYAAPEIQLKSEPIRNHYATDIFSIGVTLFSLKFNKLPFGLQGVKTYANFKNLMLQNFPKFWKTWEEEKKIEEKSSEPIDIHISPQLKDLLNNMLTAEPELRPTFSEIAKHSWLIGPDLARATEEDFRWDIYERTVSYQEFELYQSQIKRMGQ